MADKITQSNYLQLNAGFADGDTRLIKLPNPKAEIPEAQVYAVSQLLKTNQIIVGDRSGAEFVEILTGDKYRVKKTEFDLQP